MKVHQKNFKKKLKKKKKIENDNKIRIENFRQPHHGYKFFQIKNHEAVKERGVGGVKKKFSTHLFFLNIGANNIQLVVH
jgi:hypothetical protein